MSVAFQRGNADLKANLTPMIDVTFLLIVFFVLVSQIVEVESVEMQLPEPVEPVSEKMGDEQRAVVNVIPGFGGAAAAYRAGNIDFPASPEGLHAMALHLAAMYEANPNLRVNLRADQSSRYEAVQPVFRAVREAAALAGGATARVNLVVVRDD